jgi:hypothetical protein
MYIYTFSVSQGQLSTGSKVKQIRVNLHKLRSGRSSIPKERSFHQSVTVNRKFEFLLAFLKFFRHGQRIH